MLYKLALGVFALSGASAFSPAAAPARAVTRSSSSPVMSEEGVVSRRAALASLLAVGAAPLSANAMTVRVPSDAHSPDTRLAGTPY